MTGDKSLDSPALFNDPVFERFDLTVDNPVQPEQLTLDQTFQFDCNKNVECFNACCTNIDFSLTPCDILRLSRRLDVSTTQFLELFTQRYDMDPHGMPGLKMKPVDGGTACEFVSTAGCSIYGDRPTACRYYPLGIMGMRRKDESHLEDVYFMVKEAHCRGHAEPRTLTVGEYRRKQGVEHYDALNREWFDIIVKKRSAGPAVGAPSERSFQLFYMASYDLDGFRAFTQSPGFQDMFELGTEERRAIDQDDEALLGFAMRFLKQVLFGEITIPMREGAAHRRYERRKEAIEAKVDEAAERHRLRDPTEGGEDGAA